MNISILIVGFLFGAILQYANLNRYNVISGMATLENLTVAKAISVAIGAGAILFAILIDSGYASYHLKPVLLSGIIIGGLIFGSGMAILGYCPGTLPVSLGEGSIDALFGIIGALFGGLIYTLFLPAVKNILGPDLGSYSLHLVLGQNAVLFYVLVILLGLSFIGIGFWMNRIEKKSDYKWLYAGIALAILNSIVLLTAVADRPLGASTTYPYLAGLLTGNTQNEYFNKIQGAGNWELYLLAGAFLSGVIISLIRKEFKITIIHSNWRKYKGNSVPKRLFWSFIGGFILLFGARMAGGCTSGHILSGGMQLSASSFLFALFVFTGLLLTGKFFYKDSD